MDEPVVGAVGTGLVGVALGAVELPWGVERGADRGLVLVGAPVVGVAAPVVGAPVVGGLDGPGVDVWAGVLGVLGGVPWWASDRLGSGRSRKYAARARTNTALRTRVDGRAVT